MTEPQPGVSAPVALAFGTVGFFALVVAGFGLLSLATGDEVLPVTGLGPLPGIAAVVFAVAAFVLTVWAVVRRPAPRYSGVGKMLGLDNKWAFNIVKQVGNYGESFDAHLKPLGFERGLNNLWNKGGLMYAPPIR